MQKNWSPVRLDVAAFAALEGHLSGDDAGPQALQKYTRLAQDWQALPEPLIVALEVHWQAQGSLRPGPGGSRAVWLDLQAQAQLQQTCQRCLQPVAVPVSLERRYRFVADEATAERDDADQEEDLLVASQQFNLLELVEDELLMDLPLVPLHEVCPVELPQQAVSPGYGAAAQPQATGQAQGPLSQPGQEPAPADKPNPFAVLARLKIPPP